MAEDVVMAEPEETLATRRSRRSTAGNRMEAALAEMALDNSAEPDDDVDFENLNDEQDEVYSDFESTDEEEGQNEPEEAEKAINEEERRARKIARSKLEKATAAAHLKHQATFNPQAHATPTPAKEKVVRRVALGPTINAETGEVIHQPSPKKKRYSQRTSTVASTSATVARAKLEEEQKTVTPKRNKSKTKAYTQAELIARALDNEEGNIIDHRDYLKIEEEKRKRARVTRSTIEGPLIRWVSRLEEEKRAVTPPPAPLPPPPPPPPAPVQATPASTPASTQSWPGYTSSYPYWYGYNLSGSSATQPYSYAYPTSAYQAQIPLRSATSTQVASSSTDKSKDAQQDTSPPTNSHLNPTEVVSQSPDPAPTSGPESQERSVTDANTEGQAAVDTPIKPTERSQANTPTITATVPSSATPSTTPSIAAPTPSTPVTSDVATPTPGYLMFSFPSTAANASTISPPYTPYPAYYAHLTSNPTASSTPPAIPTPPAPALQEPEERIETVTKNYVIHEAGQWEGVTKPPWKDTMSAVFGDHVKWEELRVFTSKARPSARLIPICPITGKQAKYKDPRTEVPFADVEAYKTLSEVLKHEYIWDPALKRYVGHARPPS